MVWKTLKGVNNDNWNWNSGEESRPSRLPHCWDGPEYSEEFCKPANPAVTQTPIKVHHLTLVCKTGQDYYYHNYLLFNVLMVFHWSLSESKSLQVSRTLLSILAVLNNVEVWMVSTRPLISKSSGLFNKPLVTVPKAPITIGIIVTFMFRSCFVLFCFFNSLSFIFTHFTI